MKRECLAIGLLVALGAGTPALATPIVIEYQATDLADSKTGGDLWQYSYFVSGFDFSATQGFSIFFDPALYGILNPPSPVNADWDLLVVQPDPLLPSSGFYDALALKGPASLADPFVVSFVWLGDPGASPGSQPFHVYQYDDEGLEILATGQTVPSAVPEPSSLLLLAVAGLSWRLLKRRG